MYYVYLGGELVFDALSDSPAVTSARLSQSVNAAAYLDLTLVPHASPAEGQEAEVRWDATTLFHGRVTEVSQGADGLWDASCVSDVDLLNDVIVPPHSTDGRVGSKCPATLSGYVQWLAETFNSRMVGGFRVDVGQNQADLLREGALSLSDDSWPTVAAALEDHVLSVGGYVDWEPHAGSGTLNVWSDIHEAAGQMVDLGQNVTDITVTRTTEGRATAIVPWSGTGDKQVTLDGATAAEAALVRNAGMCLANGAIYDPEAVAEWGYREQRVELSGVADRAGLVRAAVARLRTMSGPEVTVQCHAVDMALYREGYEHLRVGQAVRVRAEPLGVDEYLAVQDMDLDLMDPANTSYTLGVTYDTLTGQQSAFLRGLNGSINHALDKVTGVEDTIKHVVNDANTDWYLSDSPDEPLGGEWGVGNVVSVDNKYLWARQHNTMADGTVVMGEPTLVTPGIRRSLKLHRDVGEGPVWVAFIAASSDVGDAESQGMVRLTGQMGGWDASEQGAVTVTIGFQDSAYAEGQGKAGVGVVTEKSSDIPLGRTDVQSYVDNGRVGVFVRLSGKVTVSLYAEGDGFATPFVETSSEPSGTKVFDLADVETTYESAIQQADNAIRLYVKATYATQGALGEAQSTFDQRANQIQAQVEEKMDTAVAETTFVDKSTYNQFSDQITTTVESAKKVADGAATAAGEAKDAADGAKSSAETAVTRATEAKQTADSISSKVTEAVTTANGAMSKATEVEQTADGLTVKITNAQNTANSAISAAQKNGQVILETIQKYNPNGEGHLLATADKAIDDTGNSGWMHVWGWIGGWTASSGGQIDVTIPLRGTTEGSVVVSQLDDHISDFESGDGSGLRVRNVGGKVCLYFGGIGYFSSRLFAEGSGFTINNAAGGNWGTGTHIWQSHGARSQDAKTATNYLRFDSSGLCMGNVAGTLQGNVLRNSSGMQIRNGSTTLASYTASSVSLCSGKAYVGYNSSYGAVFYGQGGNTVLGDVAYRNVVTGGSTTQLGSPYGGSNTYLNGSTVSIGQSGGSVRAYVNGGWRTLTTVQRLYNPYDKCYLTTADSSEASGLISAGWQRNNGSVYFAFR